MKISWIIAAITSALAVGLWMKAPTVVTKEVPVEVIKTVTKEVPVEVVKEVPVEVVKEVMVEVIKEVEKPLPEIYKIALEAYRNYSGAKFAANQGGVLKGVNSLKVQVILADEVKNDISGLTIKNKIELELRKLGVQINDNSDVWLSYFLEAMIRDSSGILAYESSLVASEVVTLPRETGYIKYPATIWRLSTIGTVGKNNVRGIDDIYDAKLTAFLNDYLTANPRVAN
jgi:hypothetical protein